MTTVMAREVADAPPLARHAGALAELYLFGCGVMRK